MKRFDAGGRQSGKAEVKPLRLAAALSGIQREAIFGALANI